MLLAALKDSTRAAHNALEAELDVRACLSTRASWLWLLETFFGYWVPAEAKIFSPPVFSTWLPDADLRQKSSLLSRDIEAVGGGSLRFEMCQELPPFTSLAEKFGGMYVLEGATLGGQIISSVAAGHGYTTERGCAFFGSYGGNVGPMWKTFGGHLEAFGGAHADSHEEITSSAVETFAKFGAWVSRRKHEFSRSSYYSTKR